MKRSIYKFILILILTVSIPIGVAAQSESGGVENVFSYGAGLRALGMGGAFTAVANDENAKWWNPAGMVLSSAHWPERAGTTDPGWLADLLQDGRGAKRASGSSKKTTGD